MPKVIINFALTSGFHQNVQLTLVEYHEYFPVNQSTIFHHSIYFLIILTCLFMHDKYELTIFRKWIIGSCIDLKINHGNCRAVSLNMILIERKVSFQLPSSIFYTKRNEIKKFSIYHLICIWIIGKSIGCDNSESKFYLFFHEKKHRFMV